MQQRTVMTTRRRYRDRLRLANGGDVMTAARRAATQAVTTIVTLLRRICTTAPSRCHITRPCRPSTSRASTSRCTWRPPSGPNPSSSACPSASSWSARVSIAAARWRAHRVCYYILDSRITQVAVRGHVRLYCAACTYMHVLTRCLFTLQYSCTCCSTTTRCTSSACPQPTRAPS